MGLLGDALGFVGQIGGKVFDYFTQRKQFEYDKQVQQKTWDREDNSIQRRVEDLTKAGLSPVLAAGTGAQASAPIRAQVPGAGIGNTAVEMMQLRSALMRQKQDIATSAAQEKLNQMQAENAELQNLPMKQFLRSNMRINPESHEGAEFSPSQFLGFQYAKEALKSYEIANSIQSKAKYDAEKAFEDAKLSRIAAQQAQYDFDITKQYKVRSYDQGINGALEAVVKDLGGGGTPYASAISGVLEKVLRSAPKNIIRKGVGNYVR